MKEMKKKINPGAIVLLITGFIIIFALSTAFFGCASNKPISEKTGAVLWGENCGHCHNIRPPSSLTDEQWDVAVFHMRTRANLTAVEAEKIVEFLKMAN